MDRDGFERGWLPLWRKFDESEVFADERLWRVWCWCMSQANVRKKFASIKTGRGTFTITVNRGQFLFGRKAAAERLGYAPSTLWRAMKRLEKLGNVDIKADSKCSIVTVCNFDRYRTNLDPRGQQSEPPMNNQRTANEPPMDTTDIYRGGKANESGGEAEAEVPPHAAAPVVSFAQFTAMMALDEHEVSGVEALYYLDPHCAYAAVVRCKAERRAKGLPLLVRKSDFFGKFDEFRRAGAAEREMA